MTNAMIMALVGVPVMLLSILLPVALVVALQVWLCKRKTRWLGLILPGLSFLFSLLLVFSVGAFGLINQGGSGGTLTLEENGQVIQQTITENGMTTVYDGEGNILDQYIQFCEVLNKQAGLYGRTDEALSSAMHICIEQGVLASLLNSHMEEVAQCCDIGHLPYHQGSRG